MDKSTTQPLAEGEDLMNPIMRRLVKKAWRHLFVLSLLPACLGPQVEHPKQPVTRHFQQDAADWAKGVLGPQSPHAKGEQHVLMVAVQFPDVKPKFSLADIKERAVKRLGVYVKEQSYGLTWIKPDFMGWVPLPDPIAEYRISPDNFQVDRNRVRKLIEDTMTAMEGKVDFSRYQHMLVIPGAPTLPGRGYGMICYCANPGMLTGVRGNPRYVTLRSKGGETFSGGVFVGTENAHLGMFAHDFFHALGGVYQGKRLVP
jgi:hypothetical protein